MSKFFRNRTDAGLQLAKELLKYRESGGIVLALPRGGILIGKEIADKLKLPLDILISKKIGHPLNPEFAIGAVTENGVVEIDEEQAAQVGQEYIEQQKSEIMNESRRRRQKFTGGLFPDLEGKIVILTDDGIATGRTMIAAIYDLQKRAPKKIIVAVPVSPKDVADRIRKIVDDFEAIFIEEFYLGAVGAYFEEFEQVDDDKVVKILNRL